MKLLLLPFLTLFLLFSCKKDEPDPIIPEPTPTYHSFPGRIGANDNSTIVSQDNNLLICANYLKACVIKISKSGSQIWRKEFDAGYFSSVWGIAQTNNQDIFLCGYTGGFNLKIDVLLIKLNPEGDTIWTRTYGGNADDYGYFIINTQDGNLLICGISYSYSTDHSSDIYLLKVNTDGDTLWTRNFFQENKQNSYHVMQTQNGEYLVTGTNNETASNRELYLLKVSNDGALIWNKKIGPATGKCGLSTIELSNGDLMTCGKNTVNNTTSQILLIKTDSQGNELWEKEYGQLYLSEEGNSIQANSDGTFTITGSSDEQHSGQSSIVLLKLNQRGDPLSMQYFGNSFSSYGQNILKDENDDNIITGEYNGTIFMTRTDNNGVFK